MMLNIIWDTRHYFFWLMAISVLCWLLERWSPWRPRQRAFRDQIWQDFFFGYVINSPRFHVLHHDVVLHGKAGQNYGIVFSVWDWLFGTAYLSADEEQPARLGFADIETFPRGLPGRFVYPFWGRRMGG